MLLTKKIMVESKSHGVISLDQRVNETVTSESKWAIKRTYFLLHLRCSLFFVRGKQNALKPKKKKTKSLKKEQGEKNKVKAGIRGYKIHDLLYI